VAEVAEVAEPVWQRWRSQCGTGAEAGPSGETEVPEPMCGEGTGLLHLRECNESQLI
jgi:hypothetical protein